MQDLHFCSTLSAGVERSCNSPWTLEDALAELVRLQPQGKLTTSNCLPYSPLAKKPCDYKCRDVPPRIAGGKFVYSQLSGLVAVQQWLQTQGPVVTSIQVYPDFKGFFKKQPKGVYTGTGAGYKVEDSFGHAVMLVGYNNDKHYFIAKNSWGGGFADGGFFRVGFGRSGVADKDSTWGLKYAPPSGPEKLEPSLLSPSSIKSGCYDYKARPNDYVSTVAALSGLPPHRVLLDNLPVIREPDEPLGGKTLLLCGVEFEEVPLPDLSQLAALLEIKKAVDRVVILVPWARGGSDDYCAWDGGNVKCDSRKNVVEINLGPLDLRGSLPPVSALKALPKLTALRLESTGLVGTLPADYGTLTNLEVLSLAFNKLTGTLPPEWAGMTKLGFLKLVFNQLTGTVPAVWSRLKSLRSLDLFQNKLSGTLPPEWAEMGDGKLERLVLARNAFTGPMPPQWGVLSKMHMLHLYQNRLTGTLPKQWRGMASMSELVICQNRLSGTLPPEWGELLNMQTLYTHTNRIVGTLPKEWAGMSLLSDLQMGRCGLSGPLPANWGSLSKLQKLYINNASVSGTLPQQWSGMVSLVELALPANRLQGTVAADWGFGMRALKILALWGNADLTGCLPEEFNGVVNLEGTGYSKSSLWSGTGIAGFCGNAGS